MGVKGLNQCQQRWWKHVSPQRKLEIQTSTENSPRYTDVPVFVNRWNKAESNQRTEAGRDAQKTERKKKEIEETEEESVTESFSATRSCNQTRRQRDEI